MRNLLIAMFLLGCKQPEPVCQASARILESPDQTLTCHDHAVLNITVLAGERVLAICTCPGLKTSP